MEFSVWHVCGHRRAQKIRFRDVDHAYDGSFTLLHYAIYSFRSRLRVRDRLSNCPRAFSDLVSKWRQNWGGISVIPRLSCCRLPGCTIVFVHTDLMIQECIIILHFILFLLTLSLALLEEMWKLLLRKQKHMYSNYRRYDYFWIIVFR